MPATVPGDFAVGIGDVLSRKTHQEFLEELRRLGGAEAAASGFCSWVRWVEHEARGFPELMEDLRRLRGAVMAIAAPVIGEL